MTAEKIITEDMLTQEKVEMEQGKATIADMHVHSGHSNDSTCPMEDMVQAQIARGTKIMAFTDHFHIIHYPEFDIFKPISGSCAEAAELAKKYAGQCQILTGVEVGERMWYPEAWDKMKEMCQYDVVIGSVHLVRHPGYEDYYSRMKFSEMPIDEIYKYMDHYFDDMMEMIETLDFDILAHLTCPLRYITGYHHVEIDLSVFEEKITKILARIIEKNIAFEVNTSSYDILGDWMPTKEIVRKYYEMGGRMVTLGSDAHVTKNASVYFEEAIADLKEIGFTHIYYYKGRKAYSIAI